MTMSILELLQHIVNEPAPRLQPEGKFPTIAEEFVDACLLKDPEARPTPKDLLVSAPHSRVNRSPFHLHIPYRITPGSRSLGPTQWTWRSGRQSFEFELPLFARTFALLYALSTCACFRFLFFLICGSLRAPSVL